MAVVIQIRRGTAAEWTSANPTLSEGEMGLETDTDQIKIGDGATAWSSLPYGGVEGPTGPTGPTGPAVDEEIDLATESGTTRTLALSDAFRLVNCTNGSGCTVSIPTNASVAYSVGTAIPIRRAVGAGVITIDPASGVTLDGGSTNVDLGDERATAVLVKTGTDAWIISGTLA